MNLKVKEVNLGHLATLGELEEYFYNGSDLKHLLLMKKEVLNTPKALTEDGVWLVNPDFHRQFLTNGNNESCVVLNEKNWTITALQKSTQHQSNPIFWGVADERGNFVICELTETNPPNGFYVSVRLHNFGARTQAVFSAKDQSGTIAILDCDTGREFGEIEQFLNNSGIAHSPVVSLNTMGTESALTNIVQMVQMVLGFEYRTHYSSNFSINGIRSYTRSVPWFLNGRSKKRSGLLVSIKNPEQFMVEISAPDPANEPKKINRQQFLITVSGGTEEELLMNLEHVTQWLLQGFNVASIEQKMHSAINQEKLYRICLVAKNPETLVEEINQAKRGIPSSLKSGREWQSRGGSYFTPTPLGENAKLAFVYPGAFNSYVGMAAELLHRFPFLHDWLSEHNDNAAEIYQADNLFPTTWGEVAGEDLQKMQQELLDQPLSMLFSGTAVAGMYTYLLENVFGIQPDAAYGYSLGEIMMFFATGFWQRTHRIKKEITESDLYKNRIAGRMDAVREFWDQTGLDYTDSEIIWNNMILMTSLDKVKAVVAKEPLVYLTHINTRRQVVIGGEPQACERVVKELKCMRFPIPVHYPMHCAPVSSEFQTLCDLNLQSIEDYLSVTFYSAYKLGPYSMESAAIAETIAGGLVNQVDFDTLTNRVYEDGHQFFIEVGARSNCSKWIGRSLKSKQFCAVSVNQAEIADEICLMKVIARLVSHGKQVTLPVCEMEE